MAGFRAELVGGRAFAASCDRAARDLTTMDAASRSAALQVAGQARSRAPRLTGRLAASIVGKPDGHAGFDVTVQLGAVYPVVMEYGGRYWRARRYLASTAESSEGVITKTYTTELEHIVSGIRA